MCDASKIAGGHLLLDNMIETTSSEAAASAGFDNETLLLNQMVGSDTQAIDSESRSNITKLNYEQDNICI